MEGKIVSDPAQERLLGTGAITLTSLLWGTTGTAATFAPQAGPLAIGAAALGIGGLLQAVIAIGALLRALPLLRANARTVMMGAIAVGVYPLAFYSSMHYAGVAVGSVISLASAPLASGLLEWVVDRAPLSRWWILAAMLGIVGSTLLCVAKVEDISARSMGATLSGIGLGLVAGGTYATYSWVVRALMVSGVERAAAMGSVFGGGGILLMPVLAVTAAPLIGSTHFLMVAGYMALVPMFVGYVLFGFGLARVPASTATTITLLEPAVATVLAVLIVGEHLTGLGWAGLAVIALTLVVLALAPINIPATAKIAPGSAANGAVAVRPGAIDGIHDGRRCQNVEEDNSMSDTTEAATHTSQGRLAPFVGGRGD